MAKVNKLPGRNACWQWTGAISGRGGYGYFWNGERSIRAHRFLLEPIPDGKHACHHCDNPRCVRPSHIFLGTHYDNMRDCSKKGRLRLENAHLAASKALRGEGNRGSKLTNEQVKAIRKLANAKTRTHEEIGFIFGVSRSAIGLIVSRKAWRHLL